MNSSTTRRVGQRCTLNRSRAETSFRCCDVVVTSFDHSSKLRGASPKALVHLNSATLIFNQSINPPGPNYGRQRRSGVCRKLQKIIDTDSDSKKEMNNEAPVPTSSEMRNVVKTTRGLLATDHVILSHGYTQGHNVTVNGDRYKARITNFFIPELNNHDVQELWLQQDGATCHTARATIDLLKNTFGDRLISRFGPVNWPPRSCNLTPLDYFVCGCVKSLIYANKPQTLDHLEDNIRRVIADIRPQMLEKDIENWTSRLDYIRASRGSHMPEILFKM
ncbi:heat shock 70kDa protein 8 [Trichonephila clavipes]|nr:heat shock 70kDa protein 8 [Trichonephila clavipes]